MKTVIHVHEGFSWCEIPPGGTSVWGHTPEEIEDVLDGLCDLGSISPSDAYEVVSADSADGLEYNR